MSVLVNIAKNIAQTNLQHNEIKDGLEQAAFLLRQVRDSANSSLPFGDYSLRYSQTEDMYTDDSSNEQFTELEAMFLYSMWYANQDDQPDSDADDQPVLTPFIPGNRVIH